MDQQLLDGAQQALTEHGIAGASMERIAAAAGTSRMTLHRHGITKPAILAALAERLEGAYREAMWPALVADGSAPERLALALRGQCSVAEAYAPLLEALDGPGRDAIFHERDGDRLTQPGFVEALRRILSDGIAEGTLRSGDVDETATLLFNLTGHTYRHLRAGHGWDEERAVSGVIDVVVHGVAAR